MPDPIAGELRSAYCAFIDAAGAGAIPGPFEGWSASLVAAHVTITTRLLCFTAADVLEARPARFDNRPALYQPYLQAVADSAGNWQALLDSLRRGAAELTSLIELMDSGHLSTAVPTLIVDGDSVLLHGTVSWLTVLRAQARTHLPTHAAQIARLRVLD